MTDVAADTQRLPRGLRSGQLIGARYRIDRVAGAGGMATVWLAHDERLQRPVAIKVISDALAANPAAVARFAREARTHARIQHPNLVQVYDYSIAAAQPYLVMEYVNGSTLSERFVGASPTPPPLQTPPFELLSAIACVHDHGVLHRDIKHGNVLLDRHDRARLTDFGLARLEDSTRITRPDEVVGTLRFLAPELIEGQPATRQSDLYALGVLLRTATNHAQSNRRLSKLVAWLTQHDARDRPEDAHAALDFLTERPTVVRRAVPPSRSRQDPAERNDDPTRIRNPTERIGNPTERIHNPTERVLGPRPQRLAPGPRARNRVIAISALLVAVVGTSITVATSGSAPVTGPAAAAHGKATGAPHRTGTPTIDQQLQRLSADIRRAAAP